MKFVQYLSLIIGSMKIYKILFIYTGKFSNVNSLLKKQLPLFFPNSHIQSINVYDILWQHKGILLLNIFHFVKEYGKDFLLGKRNLNEIRRFYVSTVFIFDFLKKYLSKHIRAEQYLFSLQTQSVFDLSIDGLPHFIYTDHTNLCNYFYPTLSLDPTRLIKSPAYHIREKTVYNNANKIFVMGNHAKISLVQQYQIDESKVIEVGCGGHTHIPNIIDSLKYSSNNILFVGDRWDLKGGKVLIEAFKIVKNYFPEATLTIVGYNALDEKIEGCHTVGKVSIEELQIYYENASIFCMPSIVETFGTVFIEAMYYRLPIVTSNIGSNVLTVKDGVSGITTDGSVYQISQALIELLSDSEKCSRYGQAGYEIAIAKYTWDTVLEIMSYEIDNSIGITREKVQEL